MPIECPDRRRGHHVPALVIMLSAYPKVRARFKGSIRGIRDSADDGAIEIARTNWAVDALVRAGIDPEHSNLASQRGEDYDRVFETFSNGANNHMHVEYYPD